MKNYFASARRRAYQVVDPVANPNGISKFNAFIILAILISSIVAIIETESSIYEQYFQMFSWMFASFAAIFLIEYIARVWVAPENPLYQSVRLPRLKYMVSLLALLDLIVLIPFFVATVDDSLVLLRSLRLLRLLRLAGLGRFSAAMSLVSETLWERRMELLVTSSVGLLMIVFAATCLYWAEGDIQPEAFGSVPRAMWWACVTLTTVGYGDVAPITPLGKFLATLVAITGVALVAMPAGIFAASFSDALQRHRAGRSSD